MQNRLVKFSLTALCLALLTACGGGGGGGGSSDTTSTNTDNNTPINTTPQLPQATGESGQIVTIYPDSDNSVIGSLTTESLKSITIDGHTIQIERPGIYSGGWTNITEGNTTSIICCGVYDSAKIGFYDLGEDQNAYSFYNGNITAKNEIPQNGAATYQGHSLLFPGSTNMELPDVIRGTTVVNANFDNKTLVGNLSGQGFNVDINANINQNEFTGTATSSVDPGITKVEGKFYGQNAKQLAGMALPQDTNTEWGAAFIAGKQ